MASLNKVMVIGNLGGDPEMRYTASGSAVTNFNVAVNDSFKTRDGEKRETTEWFSVVTWNRLAEICSQYLVKGKQVYVEGRMQTRSWEGTDGTKHYRTELVAENVRFLGGRERDEGPAPYSADALTEDLADLPF
jgi:single-strand DNA-binding protein